MFLVQENINTLVGASQGNNFFIGNNEGNHFVTGNSFNEIHLGKGSNVITVPNVNGKFFETVIHLEDSDNIQYLQLGCSIENV
ncbi:hypothetical protein, partial [Vibrio parahaemolyticus]|uniref:hypothetical protein n=1 Tax=Vibrio parahaemolyticus TaxID=670 RepID=UPI0015DD75CE